jgi:hypothetical protein
MSNAGMGGSGIRCAGGYRCRPMQPIGSRQLIQRAYGAMGLVDFKVGNWGTYTDSVSSATLLESLQEIWRTGEIHWPMNEVVRTHHCPYASIDI